MSNDPDSIYVMRARVTAVAFGVAAAAMGYGIALVTGAKGSWALFSVVASGLAGGLLTRYLVTGIINTAGKALARTLLPSGRSTPYERAYSYEQSLAARGDIPGAIQAYSEAIAQYPSDPEPCFQAAELAARSGDARMSAGLFAQGRVRAAGNRGRELYATQRLIDLHLGPLGETGRALGELRRLIERFPNTKEAEAARQLLTRLKADQRNVPPAL